MKRIWILLLILAIILPGCNSPEQQTMPTDDTVPETVAAEDLRLTIYYLDPQILTRAPLTVEELIAFPKTEKIVVESAELKNLYTQIQALDPAILQTVDENPEVDARFYYLLENGEAEKLFEVVLGNHVIVNGVGVAYDPVFYELIETFLTQESRNSLGLDYDPQASRYLNLNTVTAYYNGQENVVLIDRSDKDQAQKQIVFSSDRQCLYKQGMELVGNMDFAGFLDGEFADVTDKLGQPHADIGSGFYIPSYITEEAYLISFYVEDEKISRIVKRDLLTGKVEQEWGNALVS